MKTINKIITKLSCKYGAPIGRADVNTCENPGRLFDCAVPMNGAYDSGGAYWGLGSQLRVKYNKSLTYIEFYRV